jgi:hypothetical protein
VRVTQKNDPEKICKQHFVVLSGFDPTYLQGAITKPHSRAEATAGGGARLGLAVTWYVRPRPFGQKSYNERGTITPRSSASPDPLGLALGVSSSWMARRIRGTRATPAGARLVTV